MEYVSYCTSTVVGRRPNRGIGTLEERGDHKRQLTGYFGPWESLKSESTWPPKRLPRTITSVCAAKLK